MKSHSPADAKLLMGGVKGLKDAWRLGVLHVKYEKLKKDTRSTATISFIKGRKIVQIINLKSRELNIKLFWIAMITIMPVSVEVQIAMLYKRIENLSDHLQSNFHK